MARKALVIGINNYDGYSEAGEIADLNNPVNDAISIAKLLDRHHGGNDNFAVKKFFVDRHNDLSDENISLIDDFSTADFYNEINSLFSGTFESVVLYFAGHGFRDDLTDNDYLITSDGSFPNYGVPLSFILDKANQAYPKIHNTTIIIDACHSGAFGEDRLLGNNVSVVGKGVTILTGCQAEELAGDGYLGTNGVFTEMLVDGLNGQAGDLFGRVTPASLYNLVDQRLSPLEQRPVFKTNVANLVMLRQAKGSLSKSKVREVLDYFKSKNAHYALGPECEPVADRGAVKKFVKHVKFNRAAHLKYRNLQSFFRNGLVAPKVPKRAPKYWKDVKENSAWPPPEDGSFSMWHAALYSTGCELTAYGKKYWDLNKTGQL